MHLPIRSTAHPLHLSDDDCPDGYRYILVRLLLTMCEVPRCDVVVYDRLVDDFKIDPLSPCFRDCMCDPTIKFDAKRIEEKYNDFIVYRGILYDPRRGIRRSAKVGKSSTSYKVFQEIIEGGSDKDPTHV